MGMILQDPKYSLNPVMTVGAADREACRRMSGLGAAREAQARGELEAVHIRDPERVWKLYPHELSGGMGQRVMIAMMVLAEPDLLIADEPTSALDVTVRTQVLDILDELVAQRGMGLIFISHDLNLVSSILRPRRGDVRGASSRNARPGRLAHARHPYTRGLLSACRASTARWSRCRSSTAGGWAT